MPKRPEYAGAWPRIQVDCKIIGSQKPIVGETLMSEREGAWQTSKTEPQVLVVSIKDEDGNWHPVNAEPME